ncbi:unnamed protein product [Nesidiocoris tenuis]|uniref:Uncharacterized protein n=1 Tax=Nesidiocoris tenuis TaxID=355587 RepID=A0A6H5HFV0_9HEMI|nr:unnamed protein product [Nesidiocoris tenuis]
MIFDDAQCANTFDDPHEIVSLYLIHDRFDLPQFSGMKRRKRYMEYDKMTILFEEDAPMPPPIAAYVSSTYFDDQKSYMESSTCEVSRLWNVAA